MRHKQLLEAALLCTCSRYAQADCRSYAHADSHKSFGDNETKKAEDHVETLKHIECQFGGSKIQDPILHGTLGRNLEFREGHIEIEVLRPY